MPAVIGGDIGIVGKKRLLRAGAASNHDDENQAERSERQSCVLGALPCFDDAVALPGKALTKVCIRAVGQMKEHLLKISSEQRKGPLFHLRPIRTLSRRLRHDWKSCPFPPLQLCLILSKLGVDVYVPT